MAIYGLDLDVSPPLYLLKFSLDEVAPVSIGENFLRRREVARMTCLGDDNDDNDDDWDAVAQKTLPILLPL